MRFQNTRKGSFSLYVPLFLVHLFTFNCSKEISKADIIDFNKAQNAYQDKKFDDALSRVDQVLENNPDFMEAQVLKAKILFYTRKVNEAEEILRDSLDKNENSPYVKLWLGRVLASQNGKTEEAFEIFRSVLKENPDDLVARYYLARGMEMDKDYRNAILQYQKAAAMEQYVSSIHLRMGILLQGIGMEARSAEHFDRVKLLNVSEKDVASIPAN